MNDAVDEAQRQTLEYYNRAKDYESRCKSAYARIQDLRTQNATLKNCLKSTLESMQELQQKLNDADARISVLNKRITTTKTEATDAVMTEWGKKTSMDVALELRYGLGLTWNQYNGLRFATAFKFRSGKYRRQMFRNTSIRIPCLPSEQRVLTKAREIAKNYGVSRVPGGSKVDIAQAVQDALNDNDNWHDEAGYKHLQFCADAMRIFRSGHMTNFGVRAFSDTHYYNALTSMSIIGIRRGKDDYETLSLYTKLINKRIYDNTLRETWWVGGDMCFGSCLFGLGARFLSGGSNCVWCLVDKDELSSAVESTPRTLKLLYNAAHLPLMSEESPFEFDCPSPKCGKKFRCEADVLADEASMDAKKYAKMHFGTEHMRAPLLDVEPGRYILCTLHLLLNGTKKLFHLSIVKEIHKSTIAIEVNTFIRTLGINVPDIKSALWKENFGKPISFTGSECCTILENIDTLIDIVHRNDDNHKQKW